MNLRHLLLSALLLAAILLAACGPSGPAVSDEAKPFASLKGDAAKGQTTFQGTCSSCHGPDATGMVGLGKDLTISEFLTTLSDADVVLFLTKGRSASDPLNTVGVDMPPRGGNPSLKDQDLADIVAYLRSIHK